MVIPGLVSITFRKLAPAEIVTLVRQADLQAIEWGGDVHVPHGNVRQARDVRQLTQGAGLTVAAYGSYYQLGSSEQKGLAFQSVLDTAVALGAPLIRVWAGTKSSAEADTTCWRTVVDESRRIADLAAAAGVVVAYEYHGGTLADTLASTLRLLHEVNHPNMRSLWQPSVRNISEEEVQALEQLLPFITNIHVFQWRAGGQERQPLSDGSASWRRYLEALGQSRGSHHALIEFVCRDEPEAFLEDARTLRQWLQIGNQGKGCPTCPA
jgi:sugar phosphate isomerase/epimerase